MNFLLNKLKNQKGNSISGIILVIAAMGTFITLSSGQVDKVLAFARDARRGADMHQVQTALELYYSDMGHYPLSNSVSPTKSGWENLSKDLTSTMNGSGPWISKVDIDPQENGHFQYLYWSNGQRYEISYSLENNNGAELVLLKM